MDIRRAILEALPRDLLLDLEDRLRAEALRAYDVVRRELPLNSKRGREAEGQIRFRLQEQGYEEVVRDHGGDLLVDGVMLGTDLKIFQPFARFTGPEVGVILGFASMPEPRKLPAKNQSRAAGVTLNVHLQPGLFEDATGPRPTDLFALFLTARDRARAGSIEEIAVGVIGSDYNNFIFYESLENFMGGYSAEPTTPITPEGPDHEAVTIKLRSTRRPFVPPEMQPDEKVADGSAD